MIKAQSYYLIYAHNRERERERENYLHNRLAVYFKNKTTIVKFMNLKRLRSNTKTLHISLFWEGYKTIVTKPKATNSYLCMVNYMKKHCNA